MKRTIVVLVLAALVAALAGCESPMTRTMTERASVIEAGLINASIHMPDALKLTPEQVEAFGMARVRLYEQYAAETKAVIDGLKDK